MRPSTDASASPSNLPFALEVEAEFAAAHAILLAGARERLHGEELLCDFHLVERLLSEAVAPFRDGNLNDTPPFDRRNPTAEAVAHHVATELAHRLAAAAPSVHLEWVRVTEAPRCTAIVRLHGGAVPDPRGPSPHR
ncbi:MAG: 6-pyruvoyl trahydropterin synthase family protein [Phycisphaerales bacterium]